LRHAAAYCSELFPAETAHLECAADATHDRGMQGFLQQQTFGMALSLPGRQKTQSSKQATVFLNRLKQQKTTVGGGSSVSQGEEASLWSCSPAG